MFKLALWMPPDKSGLCTVNRHLCFAASEVHTYYKLQRNMVHL